MPISVSDLAKQLEIAPEAVVLHAMDLNYEIPEDDMISDEMALEIRNVELGSEISQVDHEYEEQREREIIEEQQKRTVAQKKVVPRKKTSKPKKEEEIVIEKDEDGTLIIPDYITVRDFAARIGKPLPLVLIKLKQNGIIANPKKEIDVETAIVIASDFGVKVKKESAELSGEDLFRGDLSELLKEEDTEDLVDRPPVISVMGHVDHGKTSILDYIRKAKVAEGEAGGITQSIGAYQVEVEKKTITFLDTPGHEAFTAMRARGARSTDIAILVVAATEGLKPQSIEAINHAREAEILIIVALNKMDLDGANPEKVKGELAEQELTPEDWGGDVPCIEVSAKSGKGIDKLLETILIVAELKELKANPKRRAIGTIIEASMDQRTGVTATVLINTGTLKKGDPFVVYDQHGKIRKMVDYSGKEVKTAEPSSAVQISGLSNLPRSGDLLQVMESERVARKKAEEVASIVHEDELSKRKKLSLAHLKAKLAEGKLDQLKIIAKADTKGALEAVTGELSKIKTEKSFVKVIHSGVGEITESDVMLSAAGESIVVGFGVSCSGRIEKLADQEGVQVICENIIYHLSEKIEAILTAREEDEETEEIVGEIILKGVFAANKKMAVVGGEVTSGKARKLCRIRQFRTGKDSEGEEKEELLGEAKVESVQQGTDEKNEIGEGAECGIRIKHKGLAFEIGDRIEFFVPKKGG